MRTARTFFVGHPFRIAGATALLAIGAAVFWYLASPLWIRTELREALPVVTPAPTAATTGAAASIAPAATPAAPRVLARGELNFVDQLHNGKGPVSIVEVGTQRFVRFDEVAITNAPDVHVYLSTDTGGKYVPANTLYLGPLKATNGSFNYEIPGAPAITTYKSVVVWCRAFTTLITWADLKP